VIGCVSDDQCDTGRICNTSARQCVTGCRDDAHCASGQICQSLLCVAGCRDDAHCASGQICQSLLCVAGCRDDSQCPPTATNDPQICQNQSCRIGCRSDAACLRINTRCETLVTNSCLTSCANTSTTGSCPAGYVCQTFQTPNIGTQPFCFPKCPSVDCSGAISPSNLTCTCNATTGLCTDVVYSCLRSLQ
jgi:hypothetical protein